MKGSIVIAATLACGLLTARLQASIRRSREKQFTFLQEVACIYVCLFLQVVSAAHGGRRLIISSGDISDVDGFFALAEYSKVITD
jgi:hypothetical protein